MTDIRYASTKLRPTIKISEKTTANTGEHQEHRTEKNHKHRFLKYCSCKIINRYEALQKFSYIIIGGRQSKVCIAKLLTVPNQCNHGARQILTEVRHVLSVAVTSFADHVYLIVS